ncbi:MAG: DsrE family protein [Thermodesulfovibrionia bacterium]|nr:DsrE family protein [Thermodesulfovibrionia bacterium]
MATTKLGFIVQRPPYKSENPKLALTHAIASQSVEVYLKEGDLVTADIAFIGDGVLNCIKNQKAMDIYKLTSTETHIKMALLLDLNILVCKEDLARFGLTENDIVIDAEEFGAEMKTKVVPFSEITKMMEEVNHLLFF